LVRAGLLSERRQGTRRLYTLRAEGLSSVRGLLDLFWEESVVRLKSAIEGENAKER
jgi:DNA-binding transcriptional ArsR family regulator